MRLQAKPGANKGILTPFRVVLIKFCLLHEDLPKACPERAKRVEGAVRKCFSEKINTDFLEKKKSPDQKSQGQRINV